MTDILREGLMVSALLTSSTIWSYCCMLFVHNFHYDTLPYTHIPAHSWIHENWGGSGWGPQYSQALYALGINRRDGLPVAAGFLSTLWSRVALIRVRWYSAWNDGSSQQAIYTETPSSVNTIWSGPLLARWGKSCKISQAKKGFSTLKKVNFHISLDQLHI